MADTTIDSLQIEINAKAQTANDAIDALVDKLDVLSNSLGKLDGAKITNFAESVNWLASSLRNVAGIDGRTFTALQKNITKLADINPATLSYSATSIADMATSLDKIASSANSLEGVKSFASAISKLGNKNVATATANIPQLATALNQLMVTLSKAPTVNKSVIDMTNALANLAAQGSKVGSASASVVNGLNRTNAAAKRTASSTMSLARAFGKFYANYFLLVRGFKGMFNMMESAMELTETVNYFEVTLNNIGQSARENWKEYGYESADAYANSFAERLRESNEKLTGFTVSETGQISQSVFSGLGISPATATQYSAMFAQVANSIGMTEEASIALSEAFVRLGADWASLRNVDFEVAYEKLASGLAGQSRALRAFGVDITMASLQEIAFANGIEKSVSEMTQSEKAYLRLIAIIEQSEVAFGDLANTLASPANQMRMLSQGVQNLGTLVGNLFLPVLQKTLPVLNGFVIAMQRIVIAISESLGIDTSGFNTSLGGMDEGFGDLSDSVDEATESAEKYNRATRGWDELNVLGKDTSKGYGVGNDLVENEQLLIAYDKAIEKYRKAWEQAYENIENDAEDWADRITPKLQGVVDTIISITPALEGVLAAFISYKTMTTIQKFAKYFDPAYQAIKSVVENLDVTGQKLTVGNVMSGLRDRMTDTSKLMVGLGSVVTEFKGVHDGVEGLVTGSGNLLGNLAEIATSAGIGATGLYLAFGSTGLAFSAVTGLVSAIKGIIDAGYEVSEERIGDVLLSALTPSSGTPLEDVIDGVIEKLRKVPSEFDELERASSGLSTTRSNIELTVQEIESIKTAMDDGVISVEEGKKRLEEAFGSLATLTQEKFASIRTGLVSVLGDGGIVGEYLEKFGLDAEQTVDVVIDYTFENETRVKEIITEMQNLEFGTDEYKALEIELIKLSKGYDELAKATDKFSFSVSGINWESVLDESGYVDSQKLQKVFSSYNIALTELVSTLESAELSTSTELQRMLESGSLSKEQEETVRKTLQTLPKAFKGIREDSEKEIHQFVTLLQNDMIGKISDVIATAEKEFSKLSVGEILIYGSGETGKANYIKEALNKYLEQFDLIEGELKSQLEDLGISTSELATNFNEDFINSLFSSKRVKVTGQNYYKTETELKDGYSKMIENLKKPVEDEAKGLGEALTYGLSNGLTFNDATKEKIRQHTDGIKNAYKKDLGIHSPSKVTEEYGKFFVEGFNIGIENNMQSTFDIIDDFVRRIKNKLPSFSLFGNSFGFTLPKYAVGGFPEDGLFMANHSELVGRFSNGKTAVANNSQITQGIADAVRPAVYEAMKSALRESDMGANFKVVGDPHGMFKVVRDEARSFTKTTGQRAF